MPNDRTPPRVPRPNPLPRVSSPLVGQLLTKLGSEAETQKELRAELEKICRAGTPLVEEVSDSDEQVIVTFFYRGETAGGEPAEQVLFFANRLIDAKNLEISMMEPVARTGFFTISFRMKRDWRASYCFLPSFASSPASWLHLSPQKPLWSVLNEGVADPFNPRKCLDREMNSLSVVELDRAPVQDYLPEPGDLTPAATDWEALDDGRRIALCPVGNPQSDAPLLLVLDGETWLAMGLDQMARKAWSAGDLADCWLAMVDSGGNQQRWTELDGNAPIADYLADYLLPALAQRGVAPASELTFVCGQSLGGLASLLSVLERPESFGGAISQSASLWQPMVFERLQALADEDGACAAVAHLQLDVAVGEQEWVLEPLHRELEEKLQDFPLQLNSRTYNGGHDYACWRGEILPALARMIKFVQAQ